MTAAVLAALEPRKTPVQARSSASVEAILQATVQVLLKQGLARLTTTRVAARAGVSVGTLYQYFPNKNALLHALLKDKLNSVSEAIETAAASTRGMTVAHMTGVLAKAFVAAKFRNAELSVALYAAASDDQGGKRLARAANTRSVRALAAALEAVGDCDFQEPQRTANILFAAMAGVSRSMLENGMLPGGLAVLEAELSVLMLSYLRASSTGRDSRR